MKETNYKSTERKLNILQVHNFYREPGGEDVVVKNEAEDILEQTEYETNYQRLRRIHERCIKDVRTSEKESAIRK